MNERNNLRKHIGNCVFSVQLLIQHVLMTNSRTVEKQVAGFCAISDMWKLYNIYKGHFDCCGVDCDVSKLAGTRCML